MDSRCPHLMRHPRSIAPRPGLVPHTPATSPGPRRGAAAPGLSPAPDLSLASVPYGFAVRLRNLLYDLGWLRAHRAPVPVVSVGNLSVGGTGKTPCVEYVAEFYRDLDLRVAILSRAVRRRGGTQ